MVGLSHLAKNTYKVIRYLAPVGALLGEAVEVVEVLNVVVDVEDLDVLEVVAADDVPGMH
jgi:hypothetical protein